MDVSAKGFLPESEFKKDWISHEIGDDTVAYLEKFGLFLCGKERPDDRLDNRKAVTTSQLRNIFAEAKRIELRLDEENFNWRKDFRMLRPVLAYNTARVLQKSRDSRIKELRSVLEMAHAQVREEAHLHNFVDFFEGIIAYHKVYGGKENQTN